MRWRASNRCSRHGIDVDAAGCRADHDDGQPHVVVARTRNDSVDETDGGVACICPLIVLEITTIGLAQYPPRTPANVRASGDR